MSSDITDLIEDHDGRAFPTPSAWDLIVKLIETAYPREFKAYSSYFGGAGGDQLEDAGGWYAEEIMSWFRGDIIQPDILAVIAVVMRRFGDGG